MSAYLKFVILLISSIPRFMHSGSRLLTCGQLQQPPPLFSSSILPQSVLHAAMQAISKTSLPAETQDPKTYRIQVKLLHGGGHVFL